MAPNETVQDLEQSAEAKQKEKADKVADYLQAPRRKRKSYVIMALGRGTQDMGAGIETFVRGSFKGVAVAQPRTIDELRKNFARQIVLLVIDDEFVELPAALELIKELKSRRSTSAVPVLFLTRQPETLIEGYNKTLSAYQESDDYLLYPKAEMSHIYSKVRTGLVSSYKRRSRRYKIDLELQYFLLADDQMHKGRLIDLSIHGGLMKAEDQRIFRVGEQLKVHIPIADILEPTTGDFLKISAKVRRVFIGGTQAGISFEHVSDAQLFRLTQYLTGTVDSQASRRSVATRVRSGRP